MGGLGQEEEGCHSESCESLGGKEGFPFSLPSYLNMHPLTFLFCNPVSHSPQSSKNVFIVLSILSLQ